MNESEYAEPSAHEEGEDEELFASAKYAAKQLGCSSREIYYRMDDGRLNWVRDGRRRLVVRESLKKYIANLMSQSTSGQGTA